MTITRRQGG